MPNWLEKLFDSNEKEIDHLKPTVEEINSLEPQFQQLSNDELKAKTPGIQSPAGERGNAGLTSSRSLRSRP